MSTYRTSTTTLIPSVTSAYDLLEGQYDALLSGMCSSTAAQLAHDALHSDFTDGSIWSQIDDGLPDWATNLPSTSRNALAAARAGDIALPAALTAAAIDLASMERYAVTDGTVSAMENLGYSVQRADGIHTSAVEARRGHESFLVIIGDQGRVETDHIGLADDSCNDRQQDFIEEMERSGILFDEQFTIQHHDPRGGSPVADAARAGGSNLAEGAVINGDSRPWSFTTSLYENTGARDGRALEGGQR